MTIPVHLEGQRTARPASRRTLYADGSAARWREGADLELSHWIPNRTPAKYKADTSTAICLNFVADPARERGFDLAVNNHVDVDGTLSLYVLARAEAALPHRRTLIQAAEMGDFNAWGDEPAAVLFEALSLALHAGAGADDGERTQAAFALVDAVLGGARPPAVEPGLRALRRSVEAIERGEVQRRLVGPRFAAYAMPAGFAGDPARALAVAGFDTGLAAAVALLPHARAKADGERVQLVSVASARGWYHDLHYPGHAWAETPQRWRPPGLAAAGAGGSLRLDHAPLRAAAAALNADERAPGRWQVADRLSPFEALPGRGFPVVLSFVDAHGAAPSALPPAAVAARLAPAFEGT